jgi:hypothetical protein
LLAAIAILLLGVTAAASLPLWDKDAAHGNVPVEPVTAALQQQIIIARAEAPIARTIRDVFAEISNSSYGKTVTLQDVPLRLRGDWSARCRTDGPSLTIGENSFTRFDGAVAHEKPLQAVFQAGQVYGLVQDNGAVAVMELRSFDQLVTRGHISRSATFQAAEEQPLQRCL